MMVNPDQHTDSRPRGRTFSQLRPQRAMPPAADACPLRPSSRCVSDRIDRSEYLGGEAVPLDCDPKYSMRPCRLARH